MMDYINVRPKTDEKPAQSAARNQTKKNNEETKNIQELIRRWDSERERLYDDNKHMERPATTPIEQTC